MGSELYWKEDEAIFQATKLSPSMFGAMLKGQDAFRYQYDPGLMLYNKIPVDIKNYQNMRFESYFSKKF